MDFYISYEEPLNPNPTSTALIYAAAYASSLLPHLLSPLTPLTLGFRVGDAVATMTYDGFGEFALTPAKVALRVPRASSDIVALLTSGLTASIALSEAARLREGETVLVTAASGGTGQFAVQLAKLAG